MRLLRESSKKIRLKLWVLSRLQQHKKLFQKSQRKPTLLSKLVINFKRKLSNLSKRLSMETLFGMVERI